jgi:hypothetical protein
MGCVGGVSFPAYRIFGRSSILSDEVQSNCNDERKENCFRTRHTSVISLKYKAVSDQTTFDVGDIRPC